MPNRLEYEDVQLRYKEALQSFLASKEQPADEAAVAKEIPIITISDDNDAAMEVSAENVDDKNSVKSAAEPVPDVAAVDDGAEKQADAEAEVESAAAVVVNPDSSITDKALTDNQKTKQKTEVISSFYPPTFFLSLSLSLCSFSLSHHVLLLGSFCLLFATMSARASQQNLCLFRFDPITKILL